MTVVLSMLNLVPGGMGGSETYARELLRELARSDLDVSTLVSPVAAGFSPGVREQIAPEYPTGRSDRERARALVLGVLRQKRLAARTATAAVLHFPFTVPIPRPHQGQENIVSLLDVQHHDLPQLFSRHERMYRNLTYDRAAKHATAVLTISDFAKSQMVHHLGLDADKVQVAHLGVRPEEFTPFTGGRDLFLLYPARGWPHKNHAALFDAFRILKGRIPSLRLVLTGVTRAELPWTPEGVEVMGQVSRSDLVTLYQRAAVLVFPSRYEGFGLPVIEAMSSGCPVAAASAGALPEVVGNAAVQFDPSDVEDMANAVEAALDRSSELQLLGLENAARFTWSACAALHIALYRRLGATPSPGTSPVPLPPAS